MAARLHVRISRSSSGMRERWPITCGCIVSRNSPPSSQAPSNSAVKISSTAEGGVYGRSAGEPQDVEIDRVVANPFRRQLDDPGRLAVVHQLVRIVVGHQRAVVQQPHLVDDLQRVDREIPARRAHAHRIAPGEPRQRLGGAEGQVALGRVRAAWCCLVDPGVDADLVAVVGDAAHLVGVQQGGDRGVEEASPGSARAAAARGCAASPWRSPYWPWLMRIGLSSSSRSGIGFVVGVETTAPPRSARRPARISASGCARRARGRRSAPDLLRPLPGFAVAGAF